MGKNSTPIPEFLFEIAWEVCNKVGGIHTVITSKASLMKEAYKNYFFIGPYFKEKAEEEFVEAELPEKYMQAFEELKKQGVIVHYGTWSLGCEPETFLIEFEKLAEKKNSIKKELWETHKIDSLFSAWDFEEPMLFSTAAGMLLKNLEETKVIIPERTVLHAHEWLTGMTILHLKNHDSKIKTVFTTHATILGRSMTGNGMDLYGMLGKFNPHEKAREIGISDKFTAERASAQACDIFTTVSRITGKESEFILGREPEVLVLNGINMHEFPSIEETSIKHVTSRDYLREFLAYAFFPYYKFRLEKNLSFYLAGRYEYENKGIDIYIKALGMLNEELKKTETEKTISAFLFIAMPNNGVKTELLENKNYFRHIKNVIHNKSHDLLNKIVLDLISQENTSGMFSKEIFLELKKDVLRFKRTGTPILSTHKLNVPENQHQITKAFGEAGLLNREEDRVKIILFPAYLDGNDSLLNMDFFDVIAGCHLGVFPSYYEPWGYTPLESAALGVPAITTDLAGFGRFIKDNHEKECKGICVLNMEHKSKEETTMQLAELMKKFALMEHSERIEHKIGAKALSQRADWKNLIHNYFEAHNLAINK